MKTPFKLVCRQLTEALTLRQPALRLLILTGLALAAVLNPPGLAWAQPNPFDRPRPLGVAGPRSDLGTSQAAVAIADDGSMLAVWVEGVSGDPNGYIIARRFGPDGESVGERFRLGRENAQPTPKVAVHADGTFGVAWRGGVGGAQLHFARLPPRRPGEPDAFEPARFLGEVSTLFDVLPVDILTADTTRFSVVAKDRLGRTSLFRPAARSPGPAWSLDDGERFFSQSVAFDPANLGIVVARPQSLPNGIDLDVVFQRFDGRGRPSGAERRVNTRLRGRQTNPDVAVFADGSLIVVWDSPADTEETDVFARRFGPDDEPQTGEVWVDRARSFYQFGDIRSSAPSVAATAEGYSFVSWLTTFIDDSGEGPLVSWGRLGPNLEIVDGDDGPNSEISINESQTRVTVVAPVPRVGRSAPGPVAVVWTSVFDRDFEPTAYLRLVDDPTPGELMPRVPAEINETDGLLQLEIGRSGGGLGAVSVDYEVVGLSATVGSDFLPSSGTLNWAPADTETRVIPFQLVLDGLEEGLETALIVWSNPTGLWAGRTFQSSILRIQDLNAGSIGLPTILPFVNFVDEGDQIRLDIRRRGGASGVLIADWHVEADGGAVPGVDLANVFGSMEWTEGDLTTRTIDIPTIDDDLIEGWESFFVVIDYGEEPPVGTEPSLDRRIAASITIGDNDPSSGGTFNLRRSSAQLGESNGPIAVEVERAGGSEGPATLQYSVYHNGIVYVAPPIFSVHWADGDAEPQHIVIPDLWTDTLANEEIVDGAVVQLEAVTEGTGRLGQVVNLALEIFDDDEQPGLGGRSLSPTEWACNQERLAQLQSRITMTPAFSGLRSWVALGPVQSGDITGVAALVPGGEPPGGQALLSFSTNPEETTLLSNPRRPQLATWSITRNRAASDLVAADSAWRFQLVIDPVAEPPAVSFSQLLTIDNVDGPEGQAASAKPGRGLDPLLDRCHEGSKYDAHLLSVIMRMIEPVGPEDSYHLAVYRGQSANEVRIDLYPQVDGVSDVEPIPFILVVHYDSQGRLARGWLTLDRCDVGFFECFAERNAGTGLRFRPPTLQDRPRGLPSRVLMARDAGRWIEIDFSLMLLATTWRQPQ